MNYENFNMIESNSYYSLAQEMLEDPEMDILFAGVSEYMNEIVENKNIYNINDNDIIEFYRIFLNKSNDFFYEYLIDLKEFNTLNQLEQVDIIYKLLKNDLPKWIYELTDYEEASSFDEDSDLNDEPYDVTKIDIINDKFNVKYLYEKYKQLNEGIKELELSPDYQRNFVWTAKQKSRLIESILIRIPLPIFYIDTRDDDQWVVIDGLQRFTTIFTYIDDDFKLTNLEYLKDLNGKKFSKLERKYQRKIYEFQLLCNLIRPNTPAKIAFNIFQRINTLGTKLEIQEIRNAMYKGQSTTLLSTLAKSEEFIKVATKKRIKGYSKRMEDHAIILRYLAFVITPFEQYNSNDMNKFLSKAMARINTMNEIEITSLKNTFIECMEKANVLFDEFAFIKPSEKEKNTNPISKTLFESIGITLNNFSIEEIVEFKQDLLMEINNIYKDEEFILKTSVATNNPDHLHYRFNKFEEIFKKVIGN